MDSQSRRIWQFRGYGPVEPIPTIPPSELRKRRKIKTRPRIAKQNRLTFLLKPQRIHAGPFCGAGHHVEEARPEEREIARVSGRGSLGVAGGSDGHRFGRTFRFLNPHGRHRPGRARCRDSDSGIRVFLESLRRQNAAGRPVFGGFRVCQPRTPHAASAGFGLVRLAGGSAAARHGCHRGEPRRAGVGHLRRLGYFRRTSPHGESQVRCLGRDCRYRLRQGKAELGCPGGEVQSFPHVESGPQLQSTARQHPGSERGCGRPPRR